MGLRNNVVQKMGVVTVQIEGFFTERFINLCRINNIRIWDVRNVVKGMMRFKMSIYDFKKLRMVARKTKCKVIIKDKKGLYFTFFKYRKRKLVALLIVLALLISIVCSTFVWKIDITGNENISKEQILATLKESGLYIGKSKIGLDKKEVINDLRVRMNDISWVGIELNGTKAEIEVVEKTKVAKENVQNTNTLGNIVAKKSGIITKIVPENGTAVFKEGSYIEKGTIAIEGTMYSKYIDPIKVIARGIVRANCEYMLQKEYLYNEVIKNETGKVKYTIGFTVNSKEFMLNYLNKSKKYDITKHTKAISIFGLEISFDWYECREYEEQTVEKTKEELEQMAKQDADQYLQNELLKNTTEGTLANQEVEEIGIEGGIQFRTTFTINEEIGEFVQSEGI